jgi:hypothetical protein
MIRTVLLCVGALVVGANFDTVKDTVVSVGSFGASSVVYKGRLVNYEAVDGKSHMEFADGAKLALPEELDCVLIIPDHDIQVCKRFGSYWVESVK